MSRCNATSHNYLFSPSGMFANISGIVEDWLGRRTGKWKGLTLMMSSTDVLHVLFDLKKNFVSALSFINPI